MIGSIRGCFGTLSCRRFMFFPALVAFSALLVGTSPLQAQKYDPEHPDVQALITRALGYLEAQQSNLVGTRIMSGMAVYKANILRKPGDPKDDPMVQAAIDSIYEHCTANALSGHPEFDKMYASALACVFLLELDSEKHADQIQILLDHIAERQQDSGAWGYRSNPNSGDTSQLQYICLALWLAHQEGFKVDPQMGRRALDWITRNQDGSGGWIYLIPPSNVTRGNPDTEIRHSLVAAGLGSTYLLADWLRLNKRDAASAIALRAKNADEFDLPPSVRDITNEKDAVTTTDDRKPLVDFDSARLFSTVNKGNNWFRQNFRPDPPKFTMYYMYGFERYASLREYVEGEVRGVDDWYDRGVEYLKRSQASDGSWTDSSGDMTNIIKTSFGILFLTRSMAITIDAKATGVLSGSQGFESDTILKVRGDRIIAGSIERSAEEFFELLDSASDEEIDKFARTLDEFRFDEDDASRSQQLATMRLLVTHRNWQARLVAVRFLSNQRDFKNVPALIFALTDPDPTVAVAANRGLKYVSRKTEGMDLPENPSETDLLLLKERWIEWYRHVVPGGELLEEGDGLP